MEEPTAPGLVKPTTYKHKDVDYKVAKDDYDYFAENQASSGRSVLTWDQLTQLSIDKITQAYTRTW